MTLRIGIDIGDVSAHEANGGRWLVLSHYPPKAPVEHVVRLRVRDGTIEATADGTTEEWEPLAHYCNVVTARRIGATDGDLDPADGEL